jgi:hypothetical protein
VIGREYFVRQAVTLFKFAKITKDPKISAALLEKAANLKARVDETMSPVDPSSRAPDVEPPAQSSAWRLQTIEKFTSPQVFIRRHTASQICDVVVSVRGQEIILRCPNYSQALKWARLECKSYKIPEPEIELHIPEPEIEPLISEPEVELLISKPEVEPLSGLDHDEELPLFLRSPETTGS